MFGAFGVVVLNKLYVRAGGLGKGPRVEALVKKTPLVAKNRGLDQKNFGNRGGCGAHQNSLS
jgi:hypothetical protein